MRALSFGAQRTALESFALVRGEKDGREKVWVGKVLLLAQRSVKGKSDGDEPASVRYMEFVAPLDEVDEALRCVYLQWVASGSE